MLIEGATGEVTYPDNSNGLPVRLGRSGDLKVSQLHPVGYTQVSRNKKFSVTNQAVVSTTAGTAVVFTGLAVGNPAGSGVNLVLTYFDFAQGAAGVAGTVGLMGGIGPITASLTITNRLIGSGVASKAVATAGQTISAPTVLGVFGTLGSLATTGYELVPGVSRNLEGSLVIAPGSFIATYTSAATTSALQFSLIWEEVAI